jgi:hypothetical protein
LSNVSTNAYSAIYQYDCRSLWISYGLAILSTTITVLLDLTIVLTSGSSFSDKFSTIMRVSRTAELSAEVMEQDGSGCDPLPSYLKNARVDFGNVGVATKRALAQQTEGAEAEDLEGAGDITSVRVVAKADSSLRALLKIREGRG